MEIPPLVEKKRWNEINGILIGPMGELSKTLNMLCGNGSGDAKALKLARKVKEDMFAIGTAVSKRQEESVLEFHKIALEDLTKFLELAF